MPETDWQFTDSFTVAYREYDGSPEGGSERVINVNGFLDEDGVIVLRLSDTEEGMPYLSRVEVSFLPTIAVLNTTEGNSVGQVITEAMKEGAARPEDGRFVVVGRRIREK